MTRSGTTLGWISSSLSSRLLLLTIVFVMLGEVMIYVPSIARYRLVYLEERIAASRLAAIAVEAAPGNIESGCLETPETERCRSLPATTVSPELGKSLLSHARVEAIALHRPYGKAMILKGDMPPHVDATFDLRDAHPIGLIGDAFDTLFSGGDRHIQVMADSPMDDKGIVVEVVLSERALHAGMVDYSNRILTLSVVLALATAVLVFLSLHFLMVRPMRRITASMVAFRERPEDEAGAMTPTRRVDEIGVAERELAVMQAQLRRALSQKARLATLGEAVSKINHDLRNMLATVSVVSERLAQVEDPEVQRVTPRLYQAIDRAFDFCTQTLSFARAEETQLDRERFVLRDLVDEVRDGLPTSEDPTFIWINAVASGFEVEAGRDQLFRALSNLGHNAVEALQGRQGRDGHIEVSARRESDGSVTIDMADNGPGLSAVAREHLFEPFAGSAKSGGTGLGLVIARDLLRAHSGDVDLVKSDSEGSLFRLRLPGA